jgi:hypothetical protein
MENSEQQKKVIALGKLLVKELKLEPGANTLSRWMAHYIAECITVAEQTKGIEREAAQKKCFESILKLWQHRWLLPNGKRPLENFEPLLNLLQGLNPEKESPYFFPVIPTVDNVKTKEPKPGTTQYWVDIAEQIDRVVRIWLSDVFHFAADAACDDTTKSLLENAIALPRDHDTHIIRYLIDDGTLNRDSGINEDVERKYDMERLKERIRLLEGSSQLNSHFLNLYKEQLSSTVTKTDKGGQ